MFRDPLACTIVGMTIEKPIGPRRSTSEVSGATAVSRESVIDPALTSVAGGAAASAGDLIADSERDDEPTGTGEVPTRVAGVRDAGVDSVGVPIPDDVSFGFDESDSADVAAGLGAGMETLLPSASAVRADQLGALQEQVDTGADETDRFGSIDRSAIANDYGVRYVDTAYEGGSTQRRHYSDGHEIGTQTWNYDGSYWERWADDSWEIDDHDRITERRYDELDDVHVDTEGDGTVKRIFPGNTDEIHAIKPNGDLEIDDGEGNRIVVHPDGSQTEYRGDGRIIQTPAPQEGTGGGEGEGEASTQQNEQTDEQKRQEDEAKRQEEEAKRKAEEEEQEEAEEEEQQEAEEEQSSDGGGGAGEGEDQGSEEESASRPEGEFDPAAEELLAAGRAFGLHPGAAGRHGATGNGDVDPADPAFDGGVAVGGIVDLKQRLLVDPPDPDVVGGTGRGTIPDSIEPDGGVIDPSDDAVGGPGEMGAEDDPFAGLQPALEPDASDPVGDDPVSQAIDPSMSVFDDLDLEPTRADSIMDFDGLDL
jgi:hypothetical protein